MVRRLVVSCVAAFVFLASTAAASPDPFTVAGNTTIGPVGPSDVPASTTLQLTNVSGASRELVNVSMVDGVKFSVTVNCSGATTLPIVLVDGASCDLTVTFHASIPTDYPDAVDVTFIDQRDLVDHFRIGVDGLLVAGQGAYEPTSLDFGAVPVGSESAPQTVRLTNTGPVSLVLFDEPVPASCCSTSQFQSAGPPFRVVNSSCPIHVKLAPGGFCDFSFVFAPTTEGLVTVPFLTLSDSDPFTNSQRVQLRGEGIAAPSDTSPPTVTPHVAGTLGSNGWYTSSVTVTWSVDDPESGILSSSGCDPTTLSTDTAGTTLTCSATNGASLTASSSLTVKIDQTPPAVACSVTPSHLWPPNHKLVPVAATVAVTDALSGSAGFRLDSVSGSGATMPSDIQGWDVGTSDTGGFFRAERDHADARTYTLVYSARDLAGNSGLCTATAIVAR